MCTRTHTHVDVHIHIHMYTYTRTKMCSKIAQIARIQNWHVISRKQATTNVSRIPVVVSLSRVVRAGDVNIGPTTASYRGSCLVEDSQNTHRIRETTIREAIGGVPYSAHGGKPPGTPGGTKASGSRGGCTRAWQGLYTRTHSQRGCLTRPGRPRYERP